METSEIRADKRFMFESLFHCGHLEYGVSLPEAPLTMRQPLVRHVQLSGQQLVTEGAASAMKAGVSLMMCEERPCVVRSHMKRDASQHHNRSMRNYADSDVASFYQILLEVSNR